MAYIEEIVRADGGTSCVVRWRLGGSRTGRRQSETFGAGTDAQNRARAEGFRSMVAAAGEFWPESVRVTTASCGIDHALEMSPLIARLR